jgi:deoxyribonuclease-4
MIFYDARMPILGAHMSIAGGYHLAVERMAEIATQADVPLFSCQIFTKNNNQWRAKPLSEEDIRQFREAVERHGLRSPCAHDSYLINLASPDDALWQKSVDAFTHELERAEAFGLAGVVMHPGSYVESSEEEGLLKIAKAFDEVHHRTKGFAVETWLEITAGQGTNLGYRFEHLRDIIQRSHDSRRFGVCIDTCHLFAAGYGLKTENEYAATMQQLADTIGIERVRAFHLNDSKKEQGSRVDRHEHIGEGCLGLDPFRFVLNDSRFQHLPMYLETKKEKREGEDMDAVNLRTLKSLMKVVRNDTK